MNGLIKFMLKIKIHHLDKLTNSLLDNIPFTVYEKYLNKVKKSGKYNNLLKRVRWDFLYNYVGSQWVCDNLYPYLNDDNIDSALRLIFQQYESQIQVAA